MDTKYLVKWLSSPIPGRRQKAIYKLSKLAVHGKYDRTQVIEHAFKLIRDENWSVRATAISALVPILELGMISEKIIEALIDVAKKDEHPNVKANAIIALGKIADKIYDKHGPSLKEIFKENFGSDNNDVKHATFLLGARLSLVNQEYIREYLEALKQEFNKLPSLIKSEILRYLRVLYSAASEEVGPALKELTLNNMEDETYYVLTEVLRNLALLMRENIITYDNELIEYIRKKLRKNNKPTVIQSALNVVNELIKKESILIDNFLDILLNELLLGMKNKRIKIQVLRLLNENIENIPRDLVYKHNIPRVLDVIDLNTVPKNSELAMIKNLAREILENKLGYNYELRQKLRG